MRVRLRNPDREVEMPGPKRVKDVLAELGINPDTVLVIRDRTLVMREDRLAEEDQIEIRPVISGGSRGGSSAAEAEPERRKLRTPLARRDLAAGEGPRGDGTRGTR